MSAPAPKPNRPRPPTAAEAFFRTGFGCLAAVVGKIALIVVVVLVLDWRHQQRKEREAAERARVSAERARASDTAAKLLDPFTKETDSDGRFVRKPEGPLPETDVWDRPFRLEYRQHVLSDEVRVRSAGPDGQWNTSDDVIVSRSSQLTNKSLVRDASSGLLDAAKKQLSGNKPNDAEKKDSEKK